MPKSPYLVEKLTNALNTLATHPGDARARLNAAFLNVHTLDERDFPQELQPRWRIFMEKITKKGPLLRSDGRQWKGAVENTINNMKNDCRKTLWKFI